MQLNSAECKSSVQQLSIDELYMHCSFMQITFMQLWLVVLNVAQLKVAQLDAAWFRPIMPQHNLALAWFHVNYVEFGSASTTMYCA